MPRKARSTSDGRTVGRTERRKADKMTWRQQLWLGVLVAFCQSRETAVFIGTPTTTGSIRVNVYPPDDKCVGSLSLLDNFAEEVPALLSDVFEEEITISAIERAVPWLAVAAAEAPLDRKPKLRPSEEVLVPQGPS